MKKIIIALMIFPIALAQTISLGSATGRTYARANPGDIIVFKMYVFNPGNDGYSIDFKTSLPNKYWKAAIYPSVHSTLPSKDSSFSCLDERWISFKGQYVKVCTFYLYVYVPTKVRSGRYTVSSTAFTKSPSSTYGTSAIASQARNFVFTIDVMKDGEPVPVDVPRIVNITKGSMITFLNYMSSSSGAVRDSSGRNIIRVGNEYVEPSDRFKDVVSFDKRVGNSVGQKITGMVTGNSGNILVSVTILIIGLIIIYVVFRK